MAELSRKLLIIDDDTIVRQGIVAYLEDSGFEVCQAEDGARGLERFAQEAPDLVLCDLRMPGVDGLRVLKEVHEVSPDTPVIVISGAGVMSDVVEALRLGASDYLIKPVVDMEMLVHSVEKSLERTELRSQNLRYREELEQANRDLRDHLRALERDHQAGRQVQTNLLPRTPMIFDGYRIAHRIVPSLYLSGDFIDYGYLSHRYLAFYLSDVSGHGASSAFVTIWLKHLVTHLVRDEGLFSDAESFEVGPSRFLEEINDELHETTLGPHLTCFVGVIDTQSNEICYAVGGHLPMPVLVTPEGAHYLEGKGKPIGIFTDVKWQVYRQQLPARFALVALSDGVLEMLPAEDLREKETQLLHLLSNSDGSLADVCTALGLDQLAEAPDDIAILTVAKES
ncbi:response regulator [Exilibacterium tricleocarpae]|uniref:Response regulator n=1 Tax=Exilibacterium tricleocarpae TaxID=2591008 RepID=A0A545TN99_9GAMM|nr:response regulator [Exilibacterium tricleocarpae]TQV78707.1 response regulator [Exilibacterium tricleocarpae]